ncbi:lamin tail domain-containing protein [Spirosoma endophyticum]|uniref:LTD domain-containing protein n=1 Tax=Spirosoma endophyticum TaxID=662367 RepID=A0A1I1VJU6_9BACT|nr:lamin tail domain-containing protein [Spirosoma endophyticum]SFD83085.1 Protein of unknown function [Spirosoma endophyticum]
MKKTLRKPLFRPLSICLALLLNWAFLSGVQAQTTVVQWNFNSPTPDANTATGTTTPSTGTGSLTTVGGTTASFASGDASGGSTDPATGDDSGLGITAFSAQGTGDKTRGIEFSTSTTSFQSLTVSWDQRFSNTAPNLARLQYSVDGGVTYLDTPVAVTATSGDTWFNARSVDLSAITALNNLAVVRFRILAEFSLPASSPNSYAAAGPTATYGTTGTWRFDMLTVRAASFVAPQPDLTVSLSAPVSATLNQPFNYSLVVSNPGNANASGILAQFELPAPTSLTYSSATEASGFTASQTGSIITFSGGSLTAGTSTTLTINVTPIITGNVTSGTALVDPSNTVAESNDVNNSAPAVTVNVGVAPVGQMRITEYAYDGAGTGGEFIELTNVGTAAVDLTGWSFDDSSRQPGSFAIGGLGVVQPGESVIIAENAANAFRTAWYLPATVRVIGGNDQNLGRGDEINIYDASNALVDRLTYGDNVAGVGGPRTQNISAWTMPGNLGANTVTNWQLSTVNDAQHSYASVSGNVGNPGGYNVPLNRVIVRESGNTTNIAEGGASDTYTMVLNSQPTADVVVTLASGSQLATNPTTLTFTPANYNVTQTISVSAVDDNVVEGIHSGIITHSAISSDAAYNGITINPVSVTITDNDVAVGTSPTIAVASTTTAYLSASAVSGIISDPTDPARTLGIDFIINDTDTPVSSLSVTASTNNTSVVPTANLNLTGNDASRNLKITPTGIGYATITVTVTDGSNATSYVINYAASAASTSTSRFHTGSSDASTAVDAGGGYMLVADDENQVLRLYNRTNSGLPVNGFDYTSSLGLTDISGGVPREVDIESSVRVGDRIYWLGSHSNSSGGANRPNRSRLFATDVVGSGASTTLSYIGRYDGLKTDLINWDVNNGHGLGANYFGLQASAATGIAPEADGGTGFNIEGLTIAPDGTTGYLSFRAPISPASNRTKALIVPVTNFTSLVSGNPSNTLATFGAPILFDLGGRGIREIKGNGNGQYLIVAGPSGGAGADPNAFKLYTWTGNAADAPVLRAADLSGLSGTSGSSSIESIVEVPASLDETSSIQFVLDNGDQVFYNDGTIAKELSQNTFKKSRSDYATVGAAILPDLTSILSTLPSTVYATSPVTLVMDVFEVNNVATSGPATVYITKDLLVSLSFDQTATFVGGKMVQNSNWTFDAVSNKNFYVLTTTQPIGPKGKESVGLTGVLSPGNTKGSLTLSSLVVGGNELNITNNADADKIDYFNK